ncbi:erythronolide synthase [Massilia eurypsychrophila]|uniref:Erythronolide synthase n=1 Tax=Massilia eurypsychrophila TaxID=1485217 RepID=A0A2G8T9R8_9BURK|nr:type I polyketide synthase [Massilia eurypsychrophila]PIL42806.1 erythronolide synthase [Massilia eurypsychrophila]
MKSAISTGTVAPAVIALSPQHRLAPQIAIAACRAGALGLLDIGIRGFDADTRLAVSELVRSTQLLENWGLRCDLFDDASSALTKLAGQIGLATPAPVLLLAGIRFDEIGQACAAARALARSVLLEVRNLPEALAAQRAGYDAVILKGNEAGGRVGQQSAFMLAQECAGKLDLPYWIQGGIGVHSAAAVVLSGAAGVVLCEQLWLAVEAPPAPAAISWDLLDGSETVLAGAERTPYRCFSRAGRDRLRQLERAVAQDDDWQALLLAGLRDPDAGLLATGQDIALAGPLARRYGTVGRIVTAIGRSIGERLALAAAQRALAPDTPLARSHGTRFPIAQGPMTRVSDVAPFANAVATEGALPFVALAVMRGPEVATMLAATRAIMGAMPWGVGILGFMPRELRDEQLAVLREIRPPFAIIAGGRPSQARELDALGIVTYLHVPSPGLLRGFLDAGARRFIFEGSECGGHTGPRTSFVLWQQAIDILLDAALKDAGAVHVLFAGGIHDPLSAAMVALMAAPLVAAGMKIGVLMGTAYLFTDEIVASGAIVATFQQQAIACEETSLLQSGVGIYTRCATTPFCDEFEALRRQLVIDSKSDEETLMALELMNIGRLRIAAKGITRNRDPAASAESRYVPVDAEGQRHEGLYMLGDVARLRQRSGSLADLHSDVTLGSMALLDAQLARSAPAARPRAREPIAIVGMACHFPGAQGLREYWQNIVRGVNAIREVTDDRWSADLLFDPRRGVADKVYATAGGFLDDVAFDPQRYGIAPASLSSIEPAQLLTLEVARQALADAGFADRPFARERTACIIAVGGMNDLGTIYNFRALLPHYLAKVEGLPEATRRHIIDTLFAHELPKWTEDTFPGILGNVVAGRIANRLDLGGSNFTVDAACAASLAALEVGFRQLRDGVADVALVGGVDCTNSPMGFMCFSQTYALSARGRSQPFDAGADGIVISEGVGAVVLKRLSDAERDGDRIYALVHGVGSASDGRHRSLTAPHPPGQVMALQRAYHDAAIDPAAVTLIEAHGTGTALGDQSEVAALTALLGESATPACALGSVKSMIGHTKVAAGMAGLIKGVLALQHRLLPPSIGVERPIAALQAAGSSLYLNSEARPWLHLGRAHPRYCGVSAFGFGGTNFHAVLGEYTGAYRPADARSLQPREAELFAFAGASRAEIVGALRHLLDGLALAPQVDLAQLAYSLYREQHLIRRANGGQPCRLVLGAVSPDDLRQKLARALALLAEHAPFPKAPGMHYRESVGAVGGVCFLFPGQGAQRINMLRELVSGLPALHACFAQPDDAAAAPRIADLIYPRPAFSDAERSVQQQALNATDIAQPALGMVNLAAFDVLTSYGLQADFMAGHSYGEYVALCAAGAITREELVRLSLARGRLAAAAPEGAMAALDIGAADATAAIGRHGLALSVANLNAPDQTIVAGSISVLEAALAPLAQQGIRVKRLAVGTAFHCAHMAGVGVALEAELAKVQFVAARVAVFCNVTAAPYPADGAQMRALLARHIVEPVRFADEIEALYAAGARVFVECGPGLTLTGLTARILGPRAHTVLALDAPERDGWVQLAQLLGQAVAAGLPVDLSPWFAGRGLAERRLDEVFADAVRRTNHGALIWRVNGGRALPWTHAAGAVAGARLRSPAAAPASALVAALPRTLPAALQPVATPIHYRRITMSTDELGPKRLPQHGAAAAPPAHPGPAGQLEQIQDGVARMLDFQSEQQHSLRHFLDFQAQLAGMPGLARSQPAAPAQRPGVAPPIALQQPPLPARAAPLMQRKLVRPPVLPALPQRAAAAPSTAASSALAAAVAAPAAPPAGNATAAEFSAELLKAVSARTGYPVEMLDMDAHMEADLGIDSIKRIEIFSGLTQRHSLVGEGDEEQMIEALSGFKTLREVVAWYADLLVAQPALVAGGALPKKAPTPLSLQHEEVESTDPLAQSDPVRSYVVQARSAVLAEAGVPAAWPTRFPVILVGKPSALASALYDQLVGQGHVVRQLVPGPFTRQVEPSRYEVDFSTCESVLALGGLWPPAEEPVGALINLMGWTGDDSAAGDHRHDARALFLLLKLFGPDLRRSGAGGAGRLVNLTAFDGRFGLGAHSALSVGSAGTLGVAKSAAREWAEVRVKCIDAAPLVEPAWLATQVLREMFGADPEIEVGYNAEGRWRIDLAPRVIARDELADLALGTDSVVLVTGGAYGITADLTRMLAEKYHPRLVLVGRSPLPGDEAVSTRGVDDRAALRRLLMVELRAGGQKVTPVLVETELNRILKERQIRLNLAALQGAGCTPEYHCLDVRDAGAVGALIDDLYTRLGRIDGVLHGAGVISDKLIASKPLAAFEAVFDTKVVPALVLAAKLRMPELRFIAFFSSVAGRFGNVGQADYSAANEVLNKLAGQLSHAWPHLHALAINWGPWDAGMVSDDLRRLYAARAIRPIAPAAGRRHFLDELEHGPHRQAEIVIAASIGQIAALRLAR